MSEANSNIKTQNWAIVQAFSLILFAMLFASLGTLLIIQTDEVDRSKISQLEEEIKNIKKDRDLFVTKTKTLNASWKKYQSMQAKVIHMEDSLSLGNHKVKINQQKNKLKSQIQSLEKSLNDSTFQTVYNLALNNYQSMISNFENQVKDKKTIQSYKSNYENESNLILKIETLEQEKLELHKEYVESLSGGANSSSLERENRQIGTELQECKRLLSKSLDKEEDLKSKIVYLNQGYSGLIAEVKRRLNGMTYKLLKKGSFNKQREAIILEMDTRTRELQRP